VFGRIERLHADVGITAYRIDDRFLLARYTALIGNDPNTAPLEIAPCLFEKHIIAKGDLGGRQRHRRRGRKQRCGKDQCKEQSTHSAAFMRASLIPAWLKRSSESMPRFR